jgi:type I restriction enzyme M protein
LPINNVVYSSHIGEGLLTMVKNFTEKANFIWNIANLLRGDYKQADYGKVILPLSVLRRLDCVLDETKEKVLYEYEKLKQMEINNIDPILNHHAGHKFHNRSKYNFEKLLNDPDNVAENLREYINNFSSNVREIMAMFEFDKQIEKLDKANLLYIVVKDFSTIDLSFKEVNADEMGLIYEELIRKFAEQSNETAGEHFTPREIITLMVNLLFNPDRDVFKPGIIRSLYDPACGTGGMLSIGENFIKELNPSARIDAYGQEINPETYAICKAEMLLKGQDADNIKFGNSFTQDGLPDAKFDYMLSNPPFGVEWKKYEDEIRDEKESLGHAGRFGAGLPRVSDGSLLFLQQMISKMKQNNDKSRLAVVFNGSPMFTGQAGSGESEIRRWIIENDFLEAVIALPDQLFYNTGISTYIWIVTNRKEDKRKGKIQLVNAIDFYIKMRKSLGNKRNFISEEQINKITQIYGNFANNGLTKIFNNEDFGYNRITVERPLRLNFQITKERIETINFTKALEASKTEILNILNKNISDELYKNRDNFIKYLKELFKNSKITYNAALEKALLTGLSEQDETADICTNSKGKPEPDPDLRDYENVPLKEDINEYFAREVKPYVPDAWIDYDKTKIGYEIPFTRHFYKYQELRPLEIIETEIQQLESEIQEFLGGLV